MANKARRDPLSLFKAFRNLELSEYDKSIADKEEIQNVFTYVFPESYLQNGIGSAYDVTLPKNWKIPLFQVKSKIILWHAEDDFMVGNMTKYLAKNLPNSELISLPGVGHLWIMEHVKEILGRLINA